MRYIKGCDIILVEIRDDSKVCVFCGRPTDL